MRYNVSIVEKDVSFNSVWLKKTEVIYNLINYLNYAIKYEPIIMKQIIPSYVKTDIENCGFER